MLRISHDIILQEDELEETFVRSPGPGGQNVNKVATSVQLRFNAAESPAISSFVFGRLKTLASHLMTKDGIIIIVADRYRTQGRNREDARDRLVELIRQASIRPKNRIPTKPTRTSKEKRVNEKKQRGSVKKTRGKITDF